MMISPQGTTLHYALRLNFDITNNETEYETLTAGLSIATLLKVQALVAYSASHIIINQVWGAYQAKREKMKIYLNLVQQKVCGIRHFQIYRIPGEENSLTDQLS